MDMAYSLRGNSNPSFEALPQMSIRPALEVPVATAQSIVDRVLAGRRAAAVSNIHGGEIAAVYMITFEGPYPPVVLKVYPDALHWKMLKEATVISLLKAQLSVPIPRVLLADDSKQIIALNFILMTKLDGEILAGLEPTLTREELLSGYSQIGKLLHELHRLPMNAFGYIGPNGIMTEHATNEAYLSAEFGRKLKEFREHGGGVGLARQLAKYVARWAHLLQECTRPVLCHNDLHAGNLLAKVTAGSLRLTGVLDFEGALAGDPLMDVAKALYYLTGATKTAILHGYGDMGRRHWSEISITFISCSSFGAGWPRSATGSRSASSQRSSSTVQQCDE
jgi:aminoglycoside phosphotransferase (APT) family kinase protein